MFPIEGSKALTILPLQIIPPIIGNGTHLHLIHKLLAFVSATFAGPTANIARTTSGLDHFLGRAGFVATPIT